MATTMVRRNNRTATPQRWQRALGRALAEGVQVRQLAGSGAWLATSGTDAATAYELAVTGGVAHECGCSAGVNGDPVCKHRARFYHLLGVLDLDPEPEPPTPAAPAPALRPCFDCGGSGRWRWTDGAGTWHVGPCAVCGGGGAASAEPDDLPDDPRDTAAHDAPYDHDPRPAARGFSPAERVALKADALRFAVAHDAPLRDPFTGAEIDRRNCAA